LELPRGPLPSIPWKGRNEWDETLAKAMEVEAVDDSSAATSFKHFVSSANAPEMTVAEIGGRVVGDASQAMKRFLPKAGRFLSIDIHASEHVDIVGDAHYLDDLLGAESIDALFSLSVMEHLAYPWLFAAAVNRSLRPGGLVFQSTPHTWPLHETPNDFWRFSDEALKILFGPEMGFEVIDAGMVNRIWLYPEERRGAFVDMPFNHGYGNAYIYARKVGTVERDAVRWPVDRAVSDKLAKNYPSADRLTRSLK
jgi:SAM-dependent methyltransferase